MYRCSLSVALSTVPICPPSLVSSKCSGCDLAPGVTHKTTSSLRLVYLRLFCPFCLDNILNGGVSVLPLFSPSLGSRSLLMSSDLLVGAGMPADLKGASLYVVYFAACRHTCTCSLRRAEVVYPLT